MLRFLKWVKVGFWTTVAITIIMIGGHISSLHQHASPNWSTIISNDQITSTMKYSATASARKSRSSAVKIESTSLKFWGGTATSSGTYFVAAGRPYVATVHHGIQGPCWLLVVVHDDRRYECKEYVVMDEVNDYVLMEMDSFIENRVPIQIPQDLPKGPEWQSSYSLLSRIIYTGYPNVLGPLTLRGDVVGYSREEYLYVFSHAYGGASGSGVFSENGKYIGYVVAIDVGVTEYGVDVLENIVIVAPSYNIDWDAVLN